MQGDGEKFIQAMDTRAAAMVEACTLCGDCVTACPMTNGNDKEALLGGILDMLRSGGGEGSDQWINACTASGKCIPACPEGLNMRFMQVAARMMMKRHQLGTETAKKTGAAGYRNMSRGVRVLSRLQLAPEDLARLGQGKAAPEDEPAESDFVFYIGCNVLKTPHIALLCLDVLDALGMQYRVMGGPATCCGVLQVAPGDVEGTGKLAFNTIRSLSAGGTTELLNWCPGCEKLFDDVVLPTYREATGEDTFGMSMFITYLAGRLDDLRPLLVHSVDKRVGLHEHAGANNVSEAAKQLLQAIPGLDFVELPVVQMASSCTNYVGRPELREQAHTELLEAAATAGVGTLAGVYHSCHRDLCSHEADWPFEMVNMMELIGEAMGISRPDLFKRFKAMNDVDAIIAESAELIARNGLNAADVRDEVASGILAG
ncbi:MAG: (Fe-S)-binding protein [Rhodospirillales bacterium]|jgi:Fe-S oxidoreductase|nr:hypothetical protein [Rhodospirillaceae bacterium]MDP6428901.1 (Fe-S)-binding protein [Rhodospirillales bacterium]MDP6644726.1 (Fe-S)-binding protein [Rhodospirillales bacterium]MDP6840458.1 (Fe-S)-binding protein [Rhodospirillales bacterium]